MKVLRTPEDRFADLPDFGYPPRYAEVGGLRLAYVETGPADGEPVLLLHGEPSWSFSPQGRAPVLPAGDAGLVPSRHPAVVHRPGRNRQPGSDRACGARGVDPRARLRPPRPARADHRRQDWGGLIGLRLVAEHPDRFARVVAANTGLPTGDQPMPEVWLRFREVVRTTATLSVSRLPSLPSADQRARRRSWRPTTRRFPARTMPPSAGAMPGLVPTSPDDPATEANRAAWRQLAASDKPFLVAFSDRDPITGAMGSS